MHTISDVKHDSQEYPVWRREVTGRQQFLTLVRLVTIMLESNLPKEVKRGYLAKKYQEAVDWYVDLGPDAIDIWNLNNVFLKLMARASI
jgi:hypothetical protein